MTADPDGWLTSTLARVALRVQEGRVRSIGYPGAIDQDFTPLLPLFNVLLNNVGDPEVAGLEPRHVKDVERDVVRTVASLFGGTHAEHWGYVTSGSTEGNLFGLQLARTRYSDGVLYYSDAAHYSVAKAARLLGMRHALVPATTTGEMHYDALGEAVASHGRRPAIVLATAGTTMTEAIDDLGLIAKTLDQAGASERHVHVDAALSGIPLAVAGSLAAPRLRGDTGADSICVSGHKFLGAPMPCGVVVARRIHVAGIARGVSYLDSVDSTITGSRNGHAALAMWYVLHRLGIDGLRRRAAASRALALHTVQRLTDHGYDAWRHEHAFTVVLPTPSERLVRRWALASAEGRSHIICMPGITADHIDAFVAELAQG